MLSKEILIEKMKLHFPRWMDIRKRVNQSRGGLLLVSAAEEIAEISNAIMDFKKDFFIDGYFGREEQIVDILYKTNVGNYSSLAIVSPAFDITDDIQEFFNEGALAYAHNGCLYVKKQEVNSAEITYTLNGIRHEEIMTEHHVWNAFDEFATFVGITRHQGESNIDLETRILNVYDGYVDSTEDGLKRAIMNELLAYDPDITMGSIDIAQPTPENLMSYYSEFTAVIDYMETVNQDAYKSKQWDRSLWSHSMATVDYLPHAWDSVIELYQNGVGADDDLKVEIVDPESPTNVDVNLYIQDQVAVSEYFKSSTATAKIPLTLRKYEDVTTLQKCSYKIKASRAYDITEAGVYIDYFKEHQDCITHKLSDIAGYSKDMAIEDNRVLEPDKEYSLTFTPDENGIFMISKADLQEGGITTNLISMFDQENANFKLLGGSIVGADHSALFTKTYHASNFTGAINTKAGVAVDPAGDRRAELSYDISGMEGKKIAFKYTYPEQAMPAQHITQELVEGKNRWTISGIFSQVQLDAAGANYSVQTTIGETAGDTVIISAGTHYDSTVYSMPVQMTIVINDIAGDLALSNIKYAACQFRALCEFGQITEGILPAHASNTLTVTMSGEEGLAPVLEHIYIGEPCVNTYAIEIAASAESRIIDIESKCTVSKSETAAGGVTTETNADFRSDVVYTAISDDAYIRLNPPADAPLTKILDIQESRISEMNGVKFLLFDTGESMAELTAEASVSAKLYSRALKDVIGAEATDTLYATYQSDAIIIDDGASQTAVTINRKLLEAADNVQCKIGGAAQDYLYVYKVKDGYVSSVQFDFDCLCVKPKGEAAEATSVANCDATIISPAAADVTLRNFFSPQIDMNDLYYYQIEYATPGVDVTFGKSLWHVGSKGVTITPDSGLLAQVAFLDTALVLEEGFENSDVAFLEGVYVADGKRMDINRYMVLADEGYTVHYRECSAYASLETAIQSESEFFFRSAITVTSDMFTKLKHSNIDKILYTGMTDWTGDASVSANLSHELHADEGIILWTDPALAEQTVYILYSIKIPDYIEVDTHRLYENAEYVVNAYKHVGSLKYYDIVSGSKIDLNGIKGFKMADKILVECQAPGFQALVDNGIMTIKCLVPEPKVAVKTGYYYDDGDEYYLFNNYDRDANRQENTSRYETMNVDVENGQMKFSEQSTNFVRNSAMTPEHLFNTVNIDFNKTFVSSINSLNHITACNSLNYWNTVGQTMQLAPGYNDVGIEFKNVIVDGYSYLDITSHCLTGINNIISLYARGDKFSMYIGSAGRYGEPVTLGKGFELYANDFYLANWTPDEDRVYYLIVKGACVVDDIMISETLNYDTHTKNIDRFRLATAEFDNAGYVYEITPDAIGAVMDGVEFENKVIQKEDDATDTLMLYSISTKQDFQRCAINNLIVSNNVLSTDGKSSGTLITPPIYVRDRSKIDHVSIYINNVLFSSMKGMRTAVYGTDKITDSYVKIGESSENTITVGDNIKQYIQLKVTLPAGKIINDIKVFATYKEDVVQSTKLTYISKVYDAQYRANYSLNSISVPVISNTNDVEMFIRTAKEQPSYEDMFTDWQEILLDEEATLAAAKQFSDTRFFQLKIRLKNNQARVRINNISLELI
jgi:hypothetical protein